MTMNAMRISSRAARRPVRLGVPALTVLALLSGVARAQTESPPPGSPPPPASPAPLELSPAAPAAPPADAPPPVAGPTTPTPTLTPEPVQTLPLALDQRSPQAPESGRPVPFYRKDWFWGAVGVVILTTAIILVSVASSGADTPTTTLGNMRAF
jgi:hypothetical protein